MAGSRDRVRGARRPRSARAAPAPPAELRRQRRARPGRLSRLPPLARANKTSCRSRPPEGAGGSLTLILLCGLGSSSRGDREDQRTTSPRKLPTTSKLRKMNPIFSLIFLRRLETHSRAQPPPQLSPPSFPHLRLSSSFPHPCRSGCRPLRCLPFPAPDPELPSALPSPGPFRPPLPRGPAPRTELRGRCTPPPPAASAEIQPTRPVRLALLICLLSTCPRPDPQSPSSLSHCAHESPS